MINLNQQPPEACILQKREFPRHPENYLKESHLFDISLLICLVFKLYYLTTHRSYCGDKGDPQNGGDKSF